MLFDSWVKIDQIAEFCPNWAIFGDPRALFSSNIHSVGHFGGKNFIVLTILSQAFYKLALLTITLGAFSFQTSWHCAWAKVGRNKNGIKSENM